MLITLDTTRADHLSCYGYATQTSVNLDRLATKGVLFSHAIAQAAVTPVSHASILTGLNPYTHGLRVMHGLSENRLAQTRVTLAEILREVGYHTAAFLSAFPVTERFGLDQGFDTFDADFLKDPPEKLVTGKGFVNTGKNQRHAGITTDRALAWLASVDSPYFLWLHYFDPHDGDVVPPKEVLARYGVPSSDERERLRALYDIEIEYMDQQIGRVLDWLEETSQFEKTIVVVVADHGEGLGDHNWWTHGILYQEQVRVPLIIRAPSAPAGRRVNPLVRTIDIVPTVLDLAGFKREAFPRMDGSSLVPLWKNGGTVPKHVAYCDSVNLLTYGFTPRIRDVKDDMLFAVIDGRWKYIHHALRAHESELYDLQTDPGEQVNLLESQRGVANRLKADLLARNCVPDRQLPAQGRMSAEDVERLRSLGYVGD